MNVLIIGVNGMFGEECTRLLSRKHSISGCDLQEKLEYDADVNYCSIDITDQKALLATIANINPEIVINCAAYTDVDGSEINRELAWKVNVGGVGNILKALSGSQTKLIHISTDYVFDGSQGPYDEDQPTKAVNYYGQTKLEGEELIRKSEIPWAIVRTNVLFGNTTTQKASFVRWVIDKLQRFETISVVNDQFGNPTWTYGLAEVMERIIDLNATGLFHYAGKDYVSRFEFALKIAGVFGLDPMLIRKTTTRALNQKAPRPYKAGLTCKKAEKQLKVPFYSIIESLNKMKGNA
ncbi:MAG: dTDP-4-dehydrorhamnose reductase [Candidatus Marinimicrobia bacterium]|nr:dTDP-4-dehydrorhamnose reductase [Candidatus Neomarinimicrobiota bacterium]